MNQIKLTIKNFIVKNKKYLLYLLGLILVIIAIHFYFNWGGENKISKNEDIEDTETEIYNKEEIAIFDSVYSFIFELRLENPRIVMAQCIEESGHFKSKLFLEGNNCIGMKVPSQRPTLAKSVLYSHAKFNSWKECLMDYAIWQQIYARGKNEDEYFKYLDRVYAEKSEYSTRLKNIIKENNL